ncbi:MAG: sulfate adenylyltransferase subunit CysN [Alphaproteobacteria bacterium]
MGAQEALDAEEFEAFLAAQSQRSLLRFITCGSVDDGKSTLIGRLLYESKLLFEDQLSAFEAESKRHGTRDGGLDFALLVDGLAAEREQGITIDVAYRFFATDKRKFIVADTPGHEQYTRNMATGASTADLAIVLVDARKGVLAQTRRHSIIVSMLGVKHVVLAVNKMDLVNWSEFAFAKIERDYRAFAKTLGFEQITCIPLAALEGDNVVAASANMPWYGGPILLEHLETVAIADEAAARPFRLPVQWVNRPNPEFRGFAGMVTGGHVWRGDRVRALPSGKESRVARIVTADGDLEDAVAGQLITLVLEDEIDVSRGDMLVSAAEPAMVAAALDAKVLWMSEQPLRPGQPYLLKLGTKTVSATLDAPNYVLDIDTLGRREAATLRLNETGLCRLHLDQRIALDPYAANRETGGFILIDRMTNDTVAMGFVERVPDSEGGGETVAHAAAGGMQQRLSLGFRKAMSWRTIGTLATMALVYGFTGDLRITLAIGGAELAIKTALYIVHERTWARLGRGSRRPPPSGAESAGASPG